MDNNQQQLEAFLESLGLASWRKVGSHDLVLPCPFHDDTSPSFAISFHPRKWGVWTCYTCGIGGTFLDLSDRLGEDTPFIPTPAKLSSRLQDILAPAASSPTVPDLPAPSIVGERQAREYLRQYREYDEGTAEELTEVYQLYRGSGYWNRYLIMPVCAPTGSPLGFTSRNLTSKGPKNRHPAGVTKDTWLYGAEICLETFGGGEVILTEGPFDVLRLVSWGFPAVATLGPPTPAQVQTCYNLFSRIYTAFDGDEAGRKYHRTVCSSITAAPLYLPPDKDPDNLAYEEWLKVWRQKRRYRLSTTVKKVLSCY